MQKRWRGKNVNLNELSDRVEDFFKEKGFLTKRVESAEEHTILWAPQRVAKNVEQAMRTRVIGDSNDFVIELVASELTNRSIRLGMLTKPFGGGYFLLKSLRLREALEKIENEFWAYTEEKVASLAGSAERK